MKVFILLLRTIGNLSPALGGRVLSLFWFKTTKSRPNPKKNEWEAESRKVDIPHRGRTLSVLVRRPEHAVGQVVLLHGWSGRWDQMLSLANEFYQKNYEVITFDLPAHGENSGNETDLFELSEFLKSVYQILKLEKPVLICHSAGFLVACHASLIRGIEFSKLVTVNSPARFEYLIEMFREKVGFSERIDAEIWNIVERRVKVKNPQQQLSTGHLAKFPEENVLIINDKNDKEVVFSEGVQMKKIWPNARHILTQGLGHNRILHNQNVLDEIVEFCLGPVVRKQTGPLDTKNA